MELDPCLSPVNISNITCLFRVGRRDFPSVTSVRVREERMQLFPNSLCALLSCDASHMLIISRVT